MKKIKWGILGAGWIASKFVKGLREIPDAEIVAVGSRSLERAEAFGIEYNISKKYGKYKELVNDPEIDVIYVATHLPHHKNTAMLCLEAGKAVLLEKPFTTNAVEALELIEFSKKNKIFLMEAMWNRFLPIMIKVGEWLKDSLIGDLKMVDANFGMTVEWDPKHRLLDPFKGGGSIMDLGVYPVSFASLIFGEVPSNIVSKGFIGETGVDEQTAIILEYDGGKLAVIFCAVRTKSTHEAWIRGAKGSIKIHPPCWKATTATLYTKDKEETFEHPMVGNGYNYEAMEVMNCLRAGKTESDIMPLDETLSIMKTLDIIRSQIGLKYPTE